MPVRVSPLLPASSCGWTLTRLWLARTFGQEGSPYNFAGVQMNDLKKKCQQLQEDQAGMKKKVNPKVLTMIDR